MPHVEKNVRKMVNGTTEPNVRDAGVGKRTEKGNPRGNLASVTLKSYKSVSATPRS